MIHVGIEVDQETTGEHRCAANVGGAHGARWRFKLRVEERSALVLAAKVDKGERVGFACDAHLYQALQFLHNEIQAMQGLNAAMRESMSKALQ